ncbi:hypothetical protein TWF718_000545 [Orbilia javanica]|uniref:Uncharacterized protein n=1 Tax=Orbilia javanica TaxID=47235 RepID=A0AAN8RMA4_9PEZI
MVSLKNKNTTKPISIPSSSSSPNQDINKLPKPPTPKTPENTKPPNPPLSNQTDTSHKPSSFRPRAGPEYSIDFDINVGNFYVDCASSQSIYDDFAPHRPNPAVTPADWPEWAEHDREHAIPAIQDETSRCESCHCDADGLMEALPRSHPEFSRHCPDYDFVLKCIAIYGCSCHLTAELLEDEDAEPDLTKVDDLTFMDRIALTDIEVYDGIDDTRGMKLYAAYNRWWAGHTKKKSAHGTTDSGPNTAKIDRLKGAQSSERYILGDADPPYYLEGPVTDRDKYYWNSLGRGGLVSAGRSFWKRGVTSGRLGLDGRETNGEDHANKDGSARQWKKERG